MKRARIGIIAAAVLAVATMAFAQKPDFSGTWTLDPEASGMGAGGAGAPGMGAGGGGRMGGGMAGPITVKQTADTLTITRTQGDQSVTTTYNLAGKEQENTTQGRNGAVTAKYTSKWDGTKLVTTIVRDMGNGPQTSTETRSLEGATMVVETASTGRDGNPMTRKQVYKKTT